MSTTLTAPMDNPIVDPAWLANELSALRSRVVAKFPDVPDDVVATAIELATLRLAAPAKVANYLPMLIEPDVRARLQTYGQPAPPTR